MAKEENGMYYETSARDMINNPQLWNKCINKATDLLEVLDNIDISNYYIAKYIQILFGIRTLKDTEKEFNDFVSACEKKKTLDAYEFHKHFRRFMSDIDSVLDYADKFYKELKKKDSILFEFNRKEGKYKDFAKEVNDIRNSLLHEGVPTLSAKYYNSRGNNHQVCHANVASSVTFESSIYVNVMIKDSDNKSYEARSLVSRHFSLISNLLTRLTHQLLDIFIENPQILDRK